MMFSVVSFSIAYLSLFFLFYLVLVLRFLFHRPRYRAVDGTPPVSILIAVRNEENTIEDCLNAIGRLNYPPGHMEVLVGDDASTDRTWEVLNAYSPIGFSFRCVRISENLGQARGKGNVIAHLAHLASSDFFFITDADIRVPENWLGAMLAQLQAGVGIVTGVTTITGRRLFDRLQAVDWLYALGLMQAVREMGLPVATMGNNMLISREAYFSTGGYENMPFSVTEDVRLFNEVRHQGFRSVNMYHPDVLAHSTPAPYLPTLLHQRKRWMQGSMNLPWYMTIILIVHGAYYPIVLPLFFQAGFGVGASVFLGKLLLQTIFIKRCFDRLHLPVSWPLLLLFELYQLALTLVLLLFFFLPLKVNWKGRRY